MKKPKKSEFERDLERSLIHQEKALKNIQVPSTETLQATAESARDLLTKLGIKQDISTRTSSAPIKKKVIEVPTWDEVVEIAKQDVGNNYDIESLFTAEELRNNNQAIKKLNDEYKMIHRLDKKDIAIAALAGIVAAVVDILLVGIPEKTKDGLVAGPLSNFVRESFNRQFSEEEMKKLAGNKASKVPYDAQDNRHTTVYVEGLSAYYHRLLQLGHDPFLGLIFGVFDILTGKMTTIDKSGKVVSQVMDVYADRVEPTIFEAIAKQILHLKTDVNTAMGLPVPGMSLFNLLQFGSIGEAEQTIAEIVQGMYYQGYDFIHFCSLSIPTMIIEVTVRIGYSLKYIGEGHSIKESIPLSLSRNVHPKLETMLFIAHAGAVAANTGKILFTNNPLAINYPEWITFARSSYKQLKWVLIEKPALQNEFVEGKLLEELQQLERDSRETFELFAKDYEIVFH